MSEEKVFTEEEVKAVIKMTVAETHADSFASGIVAGGMISFLLAVAFFCIIDLLFKMHPVLVPN